MFPAAKDPGIFQTILPGRGYRFQCNLRSRTVWPRFHLLCGTNPYEKLYRQQNFYIHWWSQMLDSLHDPLPAKHHIAHEWMLFCHYPWPHEKPIFSYPCFHSIIVMQFLLFQKDESWIVSMFQSFNFASLQVHGLSTPNSKFLITNFHTKFNLSISQLINLPQLLIILMPGSIT